MLSFAYVARLGTCSNEAPSHSTTCSGFLSALPMDVLAMLSSRALNKPTTEYGLEDLRLIQKSVEDGLPLDTALVEFNLINRLFK